MSEVSTIHYTFDELLVAADVEVFDKTKTAVEWITYDPSIEPQYHIRRGSRHDGTLIFTIEVMREALKPLMERTSFYKPEPSPVGKAARYIIGQITRTIEYGEQDLPVGRYPGLHEIIDIPVRVLYDG